MITAAQIIDAIIVRESSEYTNNPADRGGPTKYGITLKTLSRYLNTPVVAAAAVEALTEAQAREIYTAVYVAPFQVFTGMSDMLLGLLADSAVQHGEGKAMQWLQTAIGATPDGAVGPKTLALWDAVRGMLGGGDAVYKLVLKARVKYYFAIIHNDPSQATFANGWANRVCEFI